MLLGNKCSNGNTLRKLNVDWLFLATMLQEHTMPYLGEASVAVDL